ncbi:MAG: hypothetical protein E7470_08745 [Ruminococcaceae bacterium]|nr:hypothetical protein [Oscillospiraceae bacterium]
MNTITVTNPQTGKSYQVAGSVHETELVWCGAGRDGQGKALFVKMIRYGNGYFDQKQMLKDAQEEAQTMLRARRCTDRVPELLDHWDDKKQQTYVLVMEKMPGDSLRQWMKDRPLVPGSPRYETELWLRTLIVRQLTQILQTIHTKIPALSHLDIKPENVMIWWDHDKKWQVGLVDFGTAALDHTLGTGTDGYQAPERLSRMNTAMGSGASKDVFSLGLLWYELLTDTPQEELSGLFLPSWDAPKWELRPQLPPQVMAVKHGNAYQRLFEKMTEFSPDRRCRLSQVIQDIPMKR